MKKPAVLVITGYGINCEQETAYAFKLADAEVKIVHLNDLLEKKDKLINYQILAFPGGFSYGDDTGAGNAFANQVKNNLWEEIINFVKSDKLVIGICNGFQIIANLGLLPVTTRKHGKREVALIDNNNARYTVRWVDLVVENGTPWLEGISKISLPIAHGEGKFFATSKVLQALSLQNQVALKYSKGVACEYQNLQSNPNGSLNNIAGITDITGRILGLMPHPERAIFFHQLPNWPLLKEQYKRKGRDLPEYGPGIKIFKNAVNYFK